MRKLVQICHDSLHLVRRAISHSTHFEVQLFVLEKSIIKDIADGRAMGDTSTLADVAVINFLKKNVETQKILETQETSIGKVASSG